MNRTMLFLGSLILALLALLLAIYYALPGVYHILVSGLHPPMDSQPTHVVLFGVLMALALIMALVNRPGANRPSSRT